MSKHKRITMEDLFGSMSKKEMELFAKGAQVIFPAPKEEEETQEIVKNSGPLSRFPE